MKNILFQLLFLAPIFLFAQAQNSDGTNLDEYRFLSKGYAHQVSMGLDPYKEDYVIKPIAQEQNQTEFIGLYKKGANRPQAILVVLKSNTTDPTYICLPNNQADDRVWDLYEVDRSTITDAAIWENYDAAMRDLAFQIMGDPPTEQTMPTQYSQVESASKKSNAKQTTTSEETNEATDNWVAKGAPKKETKQSVGAKEINTDVNITMDQDLVNIGVIEAPVIRGNYGSKGILVIKFCVDSDGSTTNVRYTMKGSTTYKESLKQMALTSIRNSKFEAHQESEQCGIATFRFN